MDRRTRFEGIVRGMSSVTDCPITVKMRAGVHNKNWNAHKLLPKLRDWGVSMATVSLLFMMYISGIVKCTEMYVVIVTDEIVLC